MILFTGRGALANEFAKLYPCEIISARLVSDEYLTKKIIEADVVIHNAALINASSNQSFIEGNFILTKRIIDIIEKVKPNIFLINISSMSFLKDEDNYLNPLEMSSYAFSKYISELYCLRAHLSWFTNIRFSTIFYGDEKRDGLSKLAYDSIKNNKIVIYNNGEAKRDFIPIRLAIIYLYKVTLEKQIPPIINLVSSKASSFSDFVLRVKENNPKLEVENINTITADVLCNFSNKNIKMLGEIEFDIMDFFDNYVANLNENFNLQ